MPHPKMDALVNSLSTSWMRGKKTLVFVRRVASVKELKRKLDERYDEWLMNRLLRELPASLGQRLQDLFEQYRAAKDEAETKGRSLEAKENARLADDDDNGGIDTFFAWYFRGDGPDGVVSGANIQKRFIQRGAAYATFFEDNYVADVLVCPPSQVQKRLSGFLHISEAELAPQ